LPGFYLQSEPPVRGGLGSENTFEQCVSEMALAGFTGSEVGNKYPKNPEVLKKALSLRGIEICNQWFSSLLLTKPFAEVERMMEHTDPEYVNLLFDTGHFAYCGEDPLEMVGKYVGRIKHVHLKDIRPEVVEKVKKGNFVNPSQKMFASWVQAVSVLRNMCAHNSRIYNRTIHTTPEILDTDKVIPSPAHNGLYQILLAMKYLKSSAGEWSLFVEELDTLIQNHDSVLSLTAMNMPGDWKAHLSI
jgi:hypothetical protein